jgi:uncharacterized membrane protein YkoI
MKHLPKDLTRKFANDSARIDPTFRAQLKNNLFKGEQQMAKKTKSNGFVNMLKRTNLGPVFAVLIVLVFVGTTSAAVTSSRLNQQREQESALPADLAATLSVDDIRAIALAEVPSGSITGIELEQEDGVLLYKVKFSDGSFRLYNANTGELVNKDEFETDETVPSGYVPGITLQEARTIAQNQRPGKTITKIELEVENGVVVYSVRFSDEGRVDVNADNGAVVRVKNEQGSDDSSDDSIDDPSDDSIDDNSGSDDSGSDDSVDDSPEDSDDSIDDPSDDSIDDNSGSDDSDNR